MMNNVLKKDELLDHLQQADMRVLLMVLYHLTGQAQWLQPPFTPRRDVRLISDEDAGLDEALCAQIREAAADALVGDGAPAVHDPGDDTIVKMMSLCLGEAVPPEYAPMIREQIGFIHAHEGVAPIPAGTVQQPVIIVGAGVSGIALGAQLLSLDVPFVILEKNPDIGGTWFDNIYPGCAVDTPNHSYSFSFTPPFRWSRYFSPQADVLAYLNDTVAQLGLRKHIRFGVEVTGARWDASAAAWQVSARSDAGAETLETPALVHALGQFTKPALPAIVGADSFTGTAFHSAQWPAGLSLKGKRVAIIGTGASAMQIVPSVADDVAHISVFQRTAQWMRPVARYQDKMSEGQQWLLEQVPYYAAWFRFLMIWRYGDGLLPLLRKDPDWPHPQRSMNVHNDRHRQQMADHIAASLSSRPELIGQCTPDYPPYGKRILLDNGWFDALLKPQVSLVTDPIDHINEAGIVTTDGTNHKFDIVIYATGFQVSDMTAGVDIVGRNGVVLSHQWQGDNPTAYLGVSVPNFPNFFRMLGPNTGLGHGGSTMFQSECQARYIAGCLALGAQQDAPLEVRADVLDEYVARVDREHENLIWTHKGMTTYYRNSVGRVFSVMPWRLVDYWHMMRAPEPSDYKAVS